MNRFVSKKSRQGFSLVEILIVVMIIGILASIVIPRFASASQTARENSLKEDLHLLRTQLGVYKSQHSVYPGYPWGNTAATPTAAVTLDQLLKYSDAAGNTSSTASSVYTFGPYVVAMPANPINGKSDWKILADSDAFTADGTSGWLYQPSTGLLKANVTGNDSTGRAVIEY